MRAILFQIIPFALILSIGCNDTEHPHPPRDWEDPGPQFLSNPWTETSPETYDISNSIVYSAIEDGASVNGLESIVIIKNGTLIGEAYWQGDQQTIRHMRSCTKSIISLLTGIALDSAYVSTLDQPIAEIIIPMLTTSLDSLKSAITINHLLHMTSGFAWNESNFADWITASNQLAFVLNLPMSDLPGTKFNYNSPAVHLLGSTISIACARYLKDFATDRLFTPLGIQVFEWDVDMQGHWNGGTGLQLTTRDLAKIGYLIVQQGHNGESQIVSAQFVQTSTTNSRSGNGSMGGFSRLGYGQLWWTDSGQHEEAIIAWGYGGQFLYIVPAQYLVIATTAAWNVSAQQDNRQSEEISRYLVETVFAAVQ